MNDAPQIHRLEAMALSAEAFVPFGTYAGEPDRDPDWRASGTRVGGVTEGRDATGPLVADLWRVGDLTFGDEVPYVGFVRYYHQGFQVSQLERHPSETQTWVALAGTSFVVVAPPTGSEAPRPETVRAFIVEPGDLIAIRQGAWMCHFFPIGPEAMFNVLTARREPEQDRDLVDTVAAYGTVLEIVLSAG